MEAKKQKTEIAKVSIVRYLSDKTSTAQSCLSSCKRSAAVVPHLTGKPFVIGSIAIGLSHPSRGFAAERRTVLSAHSSFSVVGT